MIQAEFDCEGCGQHVVALGIPNPPAHGFCCMCAFLCENVPDPEEMMAIYRHLVRDRVEDEPQATKKAGGHVPTGRSL